MHGFKAYLTDANTALVVEIAVIPANVNDGRADSDALPHNLGEVFADGAYRGNHFGDAVRPRVEPRIVATGMWARDEAETLAAKGTKPACPFFAFPTRRAVYRQTRAPMVLDSLVPARLTNTGSRSTLRASRFRRDASDRAHKPGSHP